MGSISIPDPGDIVHPTSFDDFQRQTSLMTTCTLLWKELSDHFTFLEQNLLKKSDAIKDKIKTLETETKASLNSLEERETTIENSVSIAIQQVEAAIQAASAAIGTSQCEDGEAEANPEIDDSEGLLLKLKSYCVKMDSLGFWGFISCRKKEMDAIRAKIPSALAECVDPARFVLEAISEVFPVYKRTECVNDLGWACILLLESLIPVMMDPILGNSRVFVTPNVKKSAKEIAETWKQTLERCGIENVKAAQVHTFLQHLVTFGIVKDEDFDLYKKLLVRSAWRKQMPKLALSLGLRHKMPDMIEELISRGQQVDAVHFIQEVGLVDRFPPVPLLKAFLKDAKTAATSIMEDPTDSGRAAHVAARKEQSALRVVIKCIEEYRLEAEFPPENLKKRLEQLEKVKIEKRRPAVASPANNEFPPENLKKRLEQLEKVKIEKRRPAVASPANKRTRGCNVGTMPPAKAGRIANTYVSSFPAQPMFVRSPSHTQYPGGVPPYPQMYPPTNHYGGYSPESAAFSYPGTPPMNHPPAAYGVYGNGMGPAFQQAYYR